MKIWKTIGCLGLLVVIVCGCVILGRPAEVYAEEEPPQAEQNGQNEQTEQPSEEATPPTDNTATVNKTYSTGLAFRSNGDGTCAVSGVGSCTAACILIPPKSPAGDTVTEILPYAFAGSVVGAIELPGTVTVLSAASFAGCTRLGFIRVASAGAAFCERDGVLYSADGKTLLYCPVGRSAAELTLHENVRRIAAGAFAECPALERVYFTGTTAEWHSMIVGDDNDALYKAKLHFE
jgi:hypothetical protein